MKHTKYSDYVCSDCFYQLPECTCECGNFTLIQIDEALQYAVRALNEKGWFTKYCCEGHIKEGDKKESSYIYFEDRYFPPSIPTGWKKEKNGIYAYYKSGSKFPEKRLKQLAEQKAQAIQALNEWADSLGINEDF